MFGNFVPLSFSTPTHILSPSVDNSIHPFRSVRSQRKEEILAHGASQPLDGFQRQEARREIPEKRRQRVGIQHQAQRGHKRELEADIPQHVRVEERHQGGHEAQAVQPLLLPGVFAAWEGFQYSGSACARPVLFAVNYDFQHTVALTGGGMQWLDKAFDQEVA
jgi:hypothetical protein